MDSLSISEIGTKSVMDCLERVCQDGKTAYKERRRVSDIMTQPVEMLSLDHTVRAFLSFMQVNHVRHTPVVDYPNGRGTEPEFIGVISQRDVLRIRSANIHGKLSEDPDPVALRQLLSRVVTRGVQTTGPDEWIGDAVQRMMEYHVDMLPVVVDKHVVGIMTTTDLLRMIVRTGETIEEACVRQTHQKDLSVWGKIDSDRERLAEFASRTVETVMARDLITMLPGQTLAEAIRALQEHELRHIPVVDPEGKMVGILSDRDILRSLPYLSHGRNAVSKKFREDLFRIEGSKAVLSASIDQAMTRKLWTAKPTTRLVEAALTLMKKKIGALPILEADGRLLGIVTVVDMLAVVQSMVH
jgi:CBS domain-containing protein